MTDTTEPTQSNDRPTTLAKSGLCLSGGGYRAMVFHAGALRRLHELGVLHDLDGISSVSGGSIASGVVAKHWGSDGPDIEAIERDIFDLAGETVDLAAIFGAWIRLRSVSSHLSHLYDKYLFDGMSLQDIPDHPWFVFNTTNMHTGNLWRWTKEYAADYAVGKIDRPDVRLSEVVAASSAFPPVLSPSRIKAPSDIVDWDTGRPIDEPRRKLYLTDGGVYDNLGLQPLDRYRTLYVSDGGAPFSSDAKLRADWVSLTRRTLTLLQDQVGKRRRYEELLAVRDEGKERTLWFVGGASMGLISDDIGGLPVPADRLDALGHTSTRLAAMSTELRHQLMNLGYAVCDHAVRPTLGDAVEAPTDFPYPGGLG